LAYTEFAREKASRATERGMEIRPSLPDEVGCVGLGEK
jgi:hypothetical protein